MMMSRKQIFFFSNGKPVPTRLEMLKIFCREVINDCDDMKTTINLVRMYAEDVLNEMGEEE